MTDTLIEASAEEWCLAHSLTYFDVDRGENVPDPAHVVSLAALLDRVALEVKIEALESLFARIGHYPRIAGAKFVFHNATKDLDRLRVQLAALEAASKGERDGSRL